MQNILPKRNIWAKCVLSAASAYPDTVAANCADFEWIRITDGGYIFDIQGFSVHDGPGCRTLIFFKGCPLRCHVVLKTRKGSGLSLNPFINISKCTFDLFSGWKPAIRGHILNNPS